MKDMETDIYKFPKLIDVIHVFPRKSKGFHVYNDYTL